MFPKNLYKHSFHRIEWGFMTINKDVLKDQILEILRVRGEVSTSYLCAKTNTHFYFLLQFLEAFEELGVLQRRKTGKGFYWSLMKKDEPIKEKEEEHEKKDENKNINNNNIIKNMNNNKDNE